MVGLADTITTRARRATHFDHPSTSFCVSPSGLWELVDDSPRLAPWANICRPPG